MFVRGSSITDPVMTNAGVDPDNPTYKQAMASPSRLHGSKQLNWNINKFKTMGFGIWYHYQKEQSPWVQNSFYEEKFWLQEQQIS